MMRRGIEDIHRFNLSVGEQQRIATPNYEVDWLVVSVSSGVLDVYRGDAVYGAPDYRFRAGEQAAHVPMIHCGERITWTLVGNGVLDRTQGTLIFHAMHKRYPNG